ncbi:MAG: cupin domain-containing protein [Verrucomicrobiae bacterium]|nr:cupin domain-containing protein [Verrucomicrobiae bacterium]
MKFPSKTEILEGLSAWRQRFLNNVDEKTLFDEYRKTCAKVNIRTRFTSATAMRNILSGKKGLEVEDLSEILKIFKVPCFDIFLDFCRRPGRQHVARYNAEAWNKEQVTNLLGGSSPPCMLSYAPLSDDIGSRTRLDKLHLEAGGKTRWNRHLGHEFLYVNKGSVSFLVSETDDQTSAEVFVLKKGDGLAFPSNLYHCIENRGKGEAEVFVARPALVGLDDL